MGSRPSPLYIEPIVPYPWKVHLCTFCCSTGRAINLYLKHSYLSMQWSKRFIIEGKRFLSLFFNNRVLFGEINILTSRGLLRNFSTSMLGEDPTFPTTPHTRTIGKFDPPLYYVPDIPLLYSDCQVRRKPQEIS
jgi:hypothetical protein